MKLKDSCEKYDYFSGKVSDISRHLAFVGFALFWILKGDSDVGNVDYQLLVFIIFLFFTLFFDFFQYIAGTLSWGIFNRLKEKKYNNDKEKEFVAPRQINWPTLFFFLDKNCINSFGIFFLI